MWSRVRYRINRELEKVVEDLLESQIESAKKELKRLRKQGCALREKAGILRDKATKCDKAADEIAKRILDLEKQLETSNSESEGSEEADGASDDTLQFEENIPQSNTRNELSDDSTAPVNQPFNSVRDSTVSFSHGASDLLQEAAGHVQNVADFVGGLGVSASAAKLSDALFEPGFVGQN